MEVVPWLQVLLSDDNISFKAMIFSNYLVISIGFDVVECIISVFPLVYLHAQATHGSGNLSAR